jgi:hypothetical protein
MRGPPCLHNVAPKRCHRLFVETAYNPDLKTGGMCGYLIMGYRNLSPTADFSHPRSAIYTVSPVAYLVLYICCSCVGYTWAPHKKRNNCEGQGTVTFSKRVV